MSTLQDNAWLGGGRSNGKGNEMRYILNSSRDNLPKLWLPHRAAVRIANALNKKKYNDVAIEDSREVEFTALLLKC